MPRVKEMKMMFEQQPKTELRKLAPPPASFSYSNTPIKYPGVGKTSSQAFRKDLVYRGKKIYTS